MQHVINYCTFVVCHDLVWPLSSVPRQGAFSPQGETVQSYKFIKLSLFASRVHVVSSFIFKLGTVVYFLDLRVPHHSGLLSLICHVAAFLLGLVSTSSDEAQEPKLPSSPADSSAHEPVFSSSPPATAGSYDPA